MKTHRLLHIGIFTLLVTLFMACSPKGTEIQEIVEDNQEVETVKVEKNPSGIWFPEPIGYVNDFSSLLSVSEVEMLEKKIEDYDEATTNQIAIAILEEGTTTDEEFDDYIVALANEWGVGTAEKNNGLTIGIDVSLGRVYIATGVGTQEILTDDICKRIIDDYIIPEFRAGNAFEGLDFALDEIINIWGK